ncbi:MAG: LysM peptidoglycan-binding domain-containing protein [Treponema sp.]|nr:LysM peptidoglycan-binding domain-containing protein [Treponema sp.]
MLVWLSVNLFLLSTVWAQEEGRPLRATPPPASGQQSSANQKLAPNPQPLVSSPQSLIPAAYFQLLTEDAINQPLTRHYIAQYTTARGIATLNAIMERAGLYLPYIKEEVTKRRLPPELAYLPVIESGFLITARSRSGAMGLWQFMMNSISPFNIKVNDLIDERRDIIKSTNGALLKLESEYNRLGCWKLTLAAYNSGFNAVTRTIQRTGNNDYWELSEKNELRQETIHFVPKLIAVVYVLSQPRRFGINVWQEKIEWEAVPLERQVSLDVIAEEAGINKELLRRLNAELLHGISPADNNYKLKIPVKHLEQVSEILNREDLRLIKYYYHIVRSGDTIWSMSRRYGAPMAVIEQHNPGVNNRPLQIGETIIIPAYTDAPLPALTPASPRDLPGNHIVQKGETFWSLSRLYSIDPQDLAEANGMQLNQILREGRTLKVPIIDR